MWRLYPAKLYHKYLFEMKFCNNPKANGEIPLAFCGIGHILKMVFPITHWGRKGGLHKVKLGINDSLKPFIFKIYSLHTLFVLCWSFICPTLDYICHVCTIAHSPLVTETQTHEKTPTPPFKCRAKVRRIFWWMSCCCKLVLFCIPTLPREVITEYNPYHPTHHCEWTSRETTARVKFTLFTEKLNRKPPRCVFRLSAGNCVNINPSVLNKG